VLQTLSEAGLIAETTGALRAEALLAVVAIVFFLAGSVKGFLGVGLPSVAIAVTTPVLGLRAAVVLILAPTIATNVWQGLFGGALTIVLARLWPLLCAACVGTLAGATILAHWESVLFSRLLGISLCSYCIVALASPRMPRIPPQREPWLSPVVGALGGVLAGMTGLFILGMIYLHWLGLRPNQLTQALALSFLFVALALSIALQSAGMLYYELAGLSIFAILPALMGLLAGQWLRGKVSDTRFRTVFLVALLLLGVHVALRG
jgi:uncharacterized membrane protein YfcA